MVLWSEVFTTWMSGQRTVTESLAEAEPSLVVVTVALLLTVPQVAAVVGEVMWTFLVAAVAMSPKLQLSAPPPMEQPRVEFAASMDQLNPAFEGRVSVRVT